MEEGPGFHRRVVFLIHLEMIGHVSVGISGPSLHNVTFWDLGYTETDHDLPNIKLDVMHENLFMT
jgi:hypothetical protein